jgi:TonB family protein
VKICCAALLVVLTAAPCGAQAPGADEMLAAARDLYSSAEYDRSLSILERLDAAAARPEPQRNIFLYRAYCLIALGRGGEAERAIAAVVTADPLDRNIAADMSPRVQSAFRDVRRRVLPAIVQERYRLAKAAYDAREYAAAADGFDVVLKAMADPDLEAVANQPPLSDVRMLAGGFRDLSVQAAKPAPLPVVPQMSATVVSVPRPPKIYSSDDSGVVPPTTLKQSVPQMRSQTIRIGDPAVLELVIDETGAVESVVVRESINPKYDAALTDAAKKWTYQPAKVDGKPVKYRKMVKVEVQ